MKSLQKEQWKTSEKNVLHLKTLPRNRGGSMSVLSTTSRNITKKHRETRYHIVNIQHVIHFV